MGLRRSRWLARRLKALQAVSTQTTRLSSPCVLLFTWHWTINAVSDKTNLSTVALDQWTVCELDKNIAVMVTVLVFIRMRTPWRRQKNKTKHGNPTAATVTQCFLLTTQTVTHRLTFTAHKSVYVSHWAAVVRAVDGQFSDQAYWWSPVASVYCVWLWPGGSRPPCPECCIHLKQTHPCHWCNCQH